MINMKFHGQIGDNTHNSHVKEKLHSCEQEVYQCSICGFSGVAKDWKVDKINKELVCPKCGFRLNIDE